VLAYSAAEPRPDLAQDLVAGVVAEGVVELLKAVQVDQQQRQHLAAPDGRFQPLNQITAVPETVSSSVSASRRSRAVAR
jgi:hypothetical protein